MRNKSSVLILVALLSSGAWSQVPFNSGVFNPINIKWGYSAWRFPILNAFSSWFMALPLGGEGANFYYSSISPVATITVNLGSGYSPVTCPDNYSYDVCAAVISGQGTSNQVVTIYPQVHKQSSNVAVQLTNQYILENILIRVAGRVLGLEWNTTNSSSGMYKYSSYESVLNAVYTYNLPRSVDANVLWYTYAPGRTPGNSPAIEPVGEFTQYNSSGTTVGYFHMAKIIDQSISGWYTIRSIRWVFSNSGPTGSGDQTGDQGTIDTVYSNGRIGTSAGSRCTYTSATSAVKFYGSGSQSLALGNAFTTGAPLGFPIAEETSVGDVINVPHSYASCPRAMGGAIDLWNGY